MPRFYPLEKTDRIFEGYMKAFEVEGSKLLLVQHKDQLHLLENRCGHFGVPLDTGKIEDGTIICSLHSISFSLETGEIVNRPFENADPIKIHQIAYEGGDVGILLPLN